MSVHEQHRGHGAHLHLKFGVLTASDSRTAATDTSGDLIRKALAEAGHEVAFSAILRDDLEELRAAVREHLPRLDGIIITGGTGIGPRDVTIEAIRPLIDKELEGFGELFRMLSFQEIGSAAIMSRALAGIVNRRLVVALPGSPAACRLALERLLIPELGHIGSLLKG
ncbi:MAG TPA: MogA/MoaB family molybdenum cofactor biosynthesis protein [Candidatus Binataceae bacterium]|nr:MogA/MoaB family molybdenum cofactor biosynthesis protein [Candidatus Binataceae bacterium]